MSLAALYSRYKTIHVFIIFLMISDLSGFSFGLSVYAEVCLTAHLLDMAIEACVCCVFLFFNIISTKHAWGIIRVVEQNVLVTS